MTILVTGGAGYIGSHMVYALLDQNVQVVVIDNLSTGFRDAIPASVPFIVGDVGDASLVASVISEYKVDAVIHFAASTVVPESVVRPLSYYSNNTVNSISLIGAAVELNVRYFIFSSTAAVYGNTADAPISEAAFTCPISPYGRSKLMIEEVLRDTAFAHNFRYLALRYFNVAGSDPEQRTGQSSKSATHLIKVACQTALGVRPQLEIFGSDYATLDGTCVRDYIHVADLVAAHLASLAYLQEGGDCVAINCGYGHGYSVLEVIESVKRVSGCDFHVKIGNRRKGDPVAIVADATQIRSRLRWMPQYDDLDTMVSHALAWERRLLDREKG